MNRRHLIKLAIAALCPARVRMASAITTGLYAPVLMYHQISNVAGRFSTSPEAFRAQMTWLAQQGYSTVSIDHIVAALRGALTLPARCVALTLDDGWRNQFSEGVPILGEFGFSATFYLVANYIVPDGQHIHWQEADILLGRGHWLGSHSGQHRKQTEFSGAALANDMIAAYTAIRKHLGVTVTTHAYPYGSVNAAVVSAAQSAGYSAALGVEPRSSHFQNELFRMRRIEVRGGTNMTQFAKLLSM